MRPLAAVGLALLVVTCDIAGSAGPTPDVALIFAGDSAVAVGDTVAPEVSATVGGKAVDRPRYRLVSSDSSTLAVSADGLRLIGRARDTATVFVELASSLLPADAPRASRLYRVMAESLSVDRTAATFASLGDSLALRATAFGGRGQVLEGAEPVWSSLDATKVTVSDRGVVTARGNGGATVLAVLDRDTARVAVTVQQAVAHYAFPAGAVQLGALGETATLAPVARDARGNDVAGAAAPSYVVADTTVATVSAAGVVTAVGNGTTAVRATRGAASDTVAITVRQRAASVAILGDTAVAITSLGDVARLVARALDARNRDVASGAPTWTSTAPLVASVQPTTGTVTAVGVGRALVIARQDAVADTVAVVVTNAVVKIDALPAAATIASVGDTLAVVLTARNRLGDAVAAPALTLRSTDNAVVRAIDPTHATATGAGSARLIAQVGSVADTIPVTVTNAPATVNIVPTAATMASLGDTLTPLVTATNARGGALARSSLAWTTDDPTIVRVTTDGLVIARDTGTVLVRAASPADPAVRDSLLVTVTNAPAKLVLDAVLDTLAATGQALTYADTVRNARGALIPNAQVTWRSTNVSAVIVSQAGVATAVGFGAAKVIATAGAVADTVDVVVRNLSKLYVDNAVVVLGPRFGTLKRPYGKIQDAVNAGDAGDTVFVRKGSAPYAETVSLSRQTTLLGDQAAFVSGGRKNPQLLPVIAHDTGTAAIRAATSAPQTIQWFTVRHSVDGAAVDADGADVKISYVYVNPPGTTTSRIGRGISVKNSLSGSQITNVVVDSVRGYGIRLERASNATVSQDSVAGVDSIPGQHKGAGIQVVGGTNVSVSSNYARFAQGALIAIDSAGQAVVSANDLAGIRTLIAVRQSANVIVAGHALNLKTFSAGTSDDSTAAAVRVDSSTVQISNNTFTAFNPVGALAITNVRARASRVSVVQNRFIAGFRSIDADHSNVLTAGNVADSAYTYIWAVGGADTLELNADTVSNTTTYGCVFTSGDNVSVRAFSVRFTRCGTATDGAQYGFHVEGSHGYLGIDDSEVLESPFGAYVNDNALSGSTRIRRSRFTSAPTRYRTTRGEGAVLYLRAGGVELDSTVVASADSLDGAFLDGTLFVHENSISRTRGGITLGSAATVIRFDSNDLFDNRDGALLQTPPSASFLANWYGDPRGPRRDAVPAATGDSVAFRSTFSTTFAEAKAAPALPAPAASAAAALRAVRGSGQTAAHATALPKAFAVRAVDANGLPKAGVSVTFTVTSGGGSFGGQSTVTVTTDASGLAEATLTLGASAGANAATATSAGLNTVTFTATGT